MLYSTSLKALNSGFEHASGHRNVALLVKVPSDTILLEVQWSLDNCWYPWKVASKVKIIKSSVKWLGILENILTGCTLIWVCAESFVYHCKSWAFLAPKLAENKGMLFLFLNCRHLSVSPLLKLVLLHIAEGHIPGKKEEVWSLEKKKQNIFIFCLLLKWTPFMKERKWVIEPVFLSPLRSRLA